MQLTPYFRNLVLDLILGGEIYAALHTAEGEISGGGYRRQPVRYSPSTDGQKINQQPMEWKDMPEVDGMEKVVLWDAPAGGNELWELPMQKNKNSNKSICEYGTS